MANIKNKKYIYIKNFFDKKELLILKEYCKQKILEENFVSDTQSPICPSFYKDSLMNTFLFLKKERAEKEAGLKLFQTYSFWRYYIYGSILKTHTDRPECEISITAPIYNCGVKWPIHMNNKWINIKVGDALMYLGHDVPHGRKPFKGLDNPQVFFHYVDRNGPFRNNIEENVREKNTVY
tara:strand:+ start:380 stop:919 length:540 start_codon:yes stop_codon:yes gene_type:complete